MSLHWSYYQSILDVFDYPVNVLSQVIAFISSGHDAAVTWDR